MRAIAMMFLLIVSWPLRPEPLLVVTEELPPFNYQEDNQVDGIATDFVRAMLDESRLEYNIELVPWTRAYETALTRKNTLIYSILRNPRRENLFAWIEPVFEYPEGTIIWFYRLSSRKDIVIEKEEDFKNYSTAILAGYALTDRIKELVGEDKFVVVNTQKERVLMLMQGRVDLISSSSLVIQCELISLGIDPDELERVFVEGDIYALFKGHLAPSGPLYLAANPNTSEDILDNLRAAYKKVRESGYLEKAYESHRNGTRVKCPKRQ